MTLLARMIEEIASSPVLAGLALQVRAQRGRFYLDRPVGGAESTGVEVVGPDHAAGRFEGPAAGARTPPGKLVRRSHEGLSGS